MLCYSTDELPIRDRIPIWCEVFGRALLKVDHQPLAGRPFRQAVEAYAFGELGVLLYKSDGALTQRTKTQLADSNDDFIFQIARSGFSLSSQVGRELKVDVGEATLLTACEMGTHGFPGSFHGIFLRIPRRALASLVRDPESALIRRVPTSTPALRLLVDYASLTMEKHSIGRRKACRAA